MRFTHSESPSDGELSSSYVSPQSQYYYSINVLKSACKGEIKLELTVNEIAGAAGVKILSLAQNTFSEVSTDTRTLKKGDLFFALVGERFDGNNFCPKALEMGASVVTSISDFSSSHKGTILYTNDTLRALQDTAHYVRKKKNIPVMAITGSNGKTTTKEMVYSIISQNHNVLKNEGNLNNHIGVPLTILKLVPEHECAVLEFGMNSKGEIRRLAEIALPDIGMITNIGSAHIGELGSLEEIREAKLELLEKIPFAVLNKDDTFLMDGAADFKRKIVTFSMQQEAPVKGHSIRLSNNGTAFKLKIENEKEVTVNLSVYGNFNVLNALAAAALCHVYGIKASEIKTGLESFSGYSMRFEIIKKSGVTMINDAYNANPRSVQESLTELLRFKSQGRLIAVLGDMFELGAFAQEGHLSAACKVEESGIDMFVAVGEMMTKAARTLPHTNVLTFADAAEAGAHLKELIREDDIILFKGSRGMKMEKALNEVLHAL